MAEKKFSILKKMDLYVPVETEACGNFAREELIRLLAKLGTEVNIAGTVKGLSFSLVFPGCPAGKI